MAQRSLMLPVIALTGLGLGAAPGCSDSGTDLPRERTTTVEKTLINNGGYFAEINGIHGDKIPNGMVLPGPGPGGGGMSEDPGECPYLVYTETHTVIVDAEGNIVSESWTYCTQCVDADGAPIGEASCWEEPILPPDIVCYEYDDGMGNTCYECVNADGEIVESGCWPICDDPSGEMCGGGGDDCVTEVCAVDPFCCEVYWDEICEEEAAGICGGGGDDCTTKVCEVDPYCCDVSWDDICEREAYEICGGDEPPPPDCFSLFCSDNPSCCEMEWSTSCEETLALYCGEPPPPPDCFTAFCTDNPDCCEAEWTTTCEETFWTYCGIEEPPPPPEEDCSVKFCGEYPSCCEGMWDETCDEAWASICAVP